MAKFHIEKVLGNRRFDHPQKLKWIFLYYTLKLSYNYLPIISNFFLLTSKIIFRRNLFANLFPYLLLFIITAIALYITKPVSLQIRWNDETLYYTVAQNIVRHFDFNSNHYLASSIIQKGYPTKDTHLPGYPIILAFGFLIGGISVSIFNQTIFINFISCQYCFFMD